MRSIRAGSVMESVWLAFSCDRKFRGIPCYIKRHILFEIGGKNCPYLIKNCVTVQYHHSYETASIDDKTAQIFATAPCGIPAFGILYFAYFLYNLRRVRYIF